jgi:hypothetical protein
MYHCSQSKSQIATKSDACTALDSTDWLMLPWRFSSDNNNNNKQALTMVVSGE